MYRDEISLVDLATIFVRRIWIFVGIFILFVLGGVVFALVQGEQYEYVSLYEVAQKGAGEPVENPARAVAIVLSQNLPELEVAYKAEHGVRLPFDISFSNPDDTGLIRIASRASRDLADEVEGVHQALAEILKTRHEHLVTNARKALENQAATVTRTLDALKESPEAGQAIAEVMQKQVELESELASFRSGTLVVLARESVERVAPNRKLIVVIATIVGFIIAFTAVFLAEFASLVRKSLQQQR